MNFGKYNGVRLEEVPRGYIGICTPSTEWHACVLTVLRS